jgi:hypothetical protein
MLIGVDKLLKQVGCTEALGRPGRTRCRLEKALNKLKKDKVIAGWKYSAQPPPVGLQGSAQAFLESIIEITAPPFIEQRYAEITSAQPDRGRSKAVTPNTQS